MDLGTICYQKFIILEQPDWSQAGYLNTDNFSHLQGTSWTLPVSFLYSSLRNRRRAEIDIRPGKFGKKNKHGDKNRLILCTTSVVSNHLNNLSVFFNKAVGPEKIQNYFSFIFLNRRYSLLLHWLHMSSSRKLCCWPYSLYCWRRFLWWPDK